MAAKQNSTDMQEMFAAFQAFMQQQQTSEQPAAKPTRSSGKPAAKRGTKAATLNAQTATKRKSATVARKSPAGVITCGQAWELLGADPTYAPSNPSAPARNAQLWALNAKGLLRVAS